MGLTQHCPDLVELRSTFQITTAGSRQSEFDQCWPLLHREMGYWEKPLDFPPLTSCDVTNASPLPNTPPTPPSSISPNPNPSPTATPSCDNSLTLKCEWASPTAVPAA
ncbi:hypothetical protein BaRGS_00039163 [Batillaria attramentaria]|uniref:Uncharacterized protein n=1 Tax=Batillaria attramentaria TaxID=370345 RepID=A0ABD0J4F7_9CAEN